MKKVLITGMSGLVGGILRDHLQSRFELSALNRRNVPGVPCHTADIGDLDAIQSAFEGIDAVVHMAAFARPGETLGYDSQRQHRRHIQCIRSLSPRGCQANRVRQQRNGHGGLGKRNALQSAIRGSLRRCAGKLGKVDPPDCRLAQRIVRLQQSLWRSSRTALCGYDQSVHPLSAHGWCRSGRQTV